jgi:polyferredoxin
VQLGAGALVYLVVSQLGLSLWWVVLVGSVLGVVLGKVFCRWMCPLGALMESLLGAGGGEGRQQSLYMYFKLGCPIAWVGGFLNRHSLLRVRARGDTCTDCGLCDRACYVSQLAPGHSLHQTDKTNASTHYSCSRCLECVRACPTGALTLGPRRGPLPF